jgi:hypothetical protein
MLLVNNAMAIDFTVANSDNKSIRYNTIGSSTNVEVLTIAGSCYIGDVVIPNTVTYNSTLYTVTAIGNGAFSGCVNLISITMPNTITAIGNSAFESCVKLTQLVIPELVTSVGNSAFNGCIELTELIVSNSMTTLGDGAFAGCSKLSGTLTLPNSLVTIGRSAFNGCHSLASVVMKDSITTIGEDAFRRCFQLTTVSIPKSVTSIGEGIFTECNALTTINVDPQNENYTSEDGVLFDKAKTKLMQHPTAKAGYYIIPNTVTTIDNFAFYACRKLTAVAIPSLVTTIGDWAFGDCLDLKDIYIKTTTPPQIQTNTFLEVPNTANVYVCSSVSSYKDDALWSHFKNIVEDCSAAIEDIGLEEGIAVYPNPVTDNIRIVLPENVHRASFTLYDMQGKVLINQNIGRQETISVEKLPKGSYIYNVMIDNRQYRGTILK